MPPQNHITALLEGSVDAVHTYEPTTAIALSRGGVRQLYGSVYADMISPNPQGIAAAGTSFVTKYPQAAAKVVHALEKAMVFMKEHDIETRQILIKRMQLSEGTANRCVFLYMVPHKKIDMVVFQRYADMLTDIGELNGHVDVKKLIYGRLAGRVLAEAVVVGKPRLRIISFGKAFLARALGEWEEKVLW